MNKEELVFCKKIEICFQLYALAKGFQLSSYSIMLLRRFFVAFFDEINKKGGIKNEKNSKN